MITESMIEERCGCTWQTGWTTSSGQVRLLFNPLCIHTLLAPWLKQRGVLIAFLADFAKCGCAVLGAEEVPWFLLAMACPSQPCGAHFAAQQRQEAGE